MNMKKISLILLLFILTVVLGVSMTEAFGKFTLTSSTFKNGDTLGLNQVYNGYGCSGKNISPSLTWSNPPKGTKSYALIVHDPDAPVENGWYHWVVVNIPSVKMTFKEGEYLGLPIIQSNTSFDVPGYGGPCPPVGHGKHRYIFTIYALSVPRMNIKSNFIPQYVETALKPHTLGTASITGYYERK